MNADGKIILVLLFSAKQSFAAKGHSTIAIEIKIRKELHILLATSWITSKVSFQVITVFKLQHKLKLIFIVNNGLKTGELVHSSSKFQHLDLHFL